MAIRDVASGKLLNKEEDENGGASRTYIRLEARTFASDVNLFALVVAPRFIRIKIVAKIPPRHSIATRFCPYIHARVCAVEV